VSYLGYRGLLAALPIVTLAVIAGTANAQAQTAQQACRADYDRFCAGTMPGGGRIVACLKGHADQLAPQCKEALAKAGK
jgi:hypothetical protein